MKLQTKLIIAFIAIVLFMGISQSIFLHSRIQTTFQTYLKENNFGYMERMKQNLEHYYEETGSWKNVQQLYFNSKPAMGPGKGMMRGMAMNMPMANADLLLLDRKGIVIGDTAGTRIGAKGINFSGKTQVLVINGEKRGTLVLYQNKIQNLEEEFIHSSNLAIVISSIIASAMAVMFSVWIARKITNPLKNLVMGTKRIANGDKLDAVNIPTNDEFHELGEAFNDMSHKLSRNEEVRQALVADVAHELRTPLAILQGKLESIQEGVIDPTEEVILEITDEVYRLNRLVSDLQQLSLAEAGKLPLHKQLVNLKPFIERICSNLQWLADEKEITLQHDRIPDECWQQIDVDRMTQVIVNLIGNALRHTPEQGLVEITAQEIGNSLSLNISDNGPGIPKDALPFIFNRFYKRDQSRSRTEGGTGLGLSISKGFVEAHGGTITVESEVNKGTIFTVTLLKSTI